MVQSTAGWFDNLPRLRLRMPPVAELLSCLTGVGTRGLGLPLVFRDPGDAGGQILKTLISHCFLLNKLFAIWSLGNHLYNPLSLHRRYSDSMTLSPLARPVPDLTLCGLKSWCSLVIWACPSQRSGVPPLLTSLSYPGASWGMRSYRSWTWLCPVSQASPCLF